MTLSLARVLYESPAIVALGPLSSALLVGFAAVDWWGRVHLTKQGEEYLESQRGE